MATSDGVVLDQRWNSLDICIKKGKGKEPFSARSLSKSVKHKESPDYGGRLEG
jgi:hypothetical protein